MKFPIRVCNLFFKKSVTKKVDIVIFGSFRYLDPKKRGFYRGRGVNIFYLTVRYGTVRYGTVPN